MMFLKACGMFLAVFDMQNPTSSSFKCLYANQLPICSITINKIAGQNRNLLGKGQSDPGEEKRHFQLGNQGEWYSSCQKQSMRKVIHHKGERTYQKKSVVTPYITSAYSSVMSHKEPFC